MAEPTGAQDITGRLDILAYRVLERKALAHPLLAQCWNGGLGQLVEFAIGELLPDEPVIPKPKRRLRA